MKRNVLKLLLFVVLLSGSLLEANSVTKEEITKVYVATFGRSPDSAGLNYWFNNSGLYLEGISESFFDQSETQTLYPSSSSTSQFISSVYNNLFNRNPDTAGLDYWIEELDSGRIKKSLFLLAVINGAQNSSEGNDATLLTHKTEIGLYFANAGKDDVDEARNIMSGITDEPSSVDNAKVIIDSSSSENAIPTANAGVDSTILVNETITLTGIGTDTDGTIVSYEWKKGSEVLGASATLEYIPTEVGTDTLTLTVTDDDGATATDTVNIIVQNVSNIR